MVGGGAVSGGLWGGVERWCLGVEGSGPSPAHQQSGRAGRAPPTARPNAHVPRLPDQAPTFLLLPTPSPAAAP